MLTSPANPHLTAARKLAERKHRLGEQRFLVEGLRLIEDGWRSGVRPHQLFYDEAQVATSAPAQRLLAELTAAISDALERGVPHPNAVRLVLERRRKALSEPPPLAITLPEHVKRRDVPVRPHRLDGYDQLMENADDDE